MLTIPKTTYTSTTLNLISNNLHEFGDINWTVLKGFRFFFRSQRVTKVIKYIILRPFLFFKWILTQHWIKLDYNFCLSSNSHLLVILSLNSMSITKDMHIHCIMILPMQAPFRSGHVSKFNFFRNQVVLILWGT
jgi:hypothetical protein